MLHFGLKHRWADGIEDFGWSDEDKSHLRGDIVRYLVFLLRPSDCVRHTNMDLSCPREDTSVNWDGLEFLVFKNGANAAQFLILKIVRW